MNQLVTRSAINPWPWSLRFAFNQGELVEGAPARIVFCAGQAAMDADGLPTHPGDLRAQLETALNNLEAVLAGADMTLANVVRLTCYTTNVSGVMSNYDVITNRLGKHDVRPPLTLVGVTALAIPELLVELEATAVG